MAKYIMALDSGTTSNRCILFNEKGEMCSMAQREFTQYFPKPGWVEHDPEEIWLTQYSVASEAMAKLGVTAADIAAIGITNQRETTIVWDKSTGEPVYRAIVWQDVRGEGLCRELRAHGDRVQKTTGLLLSPYYPAAKLASVLRENPDPTDDEIRAYLAGNLCRCSGYEGQLRGIRSYLDSRKG